MLIYKTNRYRVDKQFLHAHNCNTLPAKNNFSKLSPNAARIYTQAHYL